MLVDLHVHTFRGSRCSRLDPEEMVLVASNKGLDAVCITEHDFLWKPEQLKQLQRNSNVLVFGGMEVSTRKGHVLAFGLPFYYPEFSSFENLRRAADDHGAFLILAHPLRDKFNYRHSSMLNLDEGLEKEASREEIIKADDMEVFNGESMVEEVRSCLDINSRLHRPGTGGSDAHYSWNIGRCITRLERQVSTVEELAAELKGRRYSPESNYFSEHLGDTCNI